MISVRRLNDAFNTSKEIYDLEVNDGVTFVTNLGIVIKKLKVNWTGTDATKHINNLVEVYNGLVQYFKYGIGTTLTAVKKVVQLQETRKANGGGGQVDTVPVFDFDFAEKVEDSVGTASYQANADIKTDLLALVSVEQSFESFSLKFLTLRDNLMYNWQSGNGRDDIKESLDEFEDLSKKYIEMVKEARAGLATAVGNLGQVID